MEASNSNGSEKMTEIAKLLKENFPKFPAWLVAASMSDGGSVSKDYEPNIKDYNKYGVESAQLAARIGGTGPLTAEERESIPKLLIVGRTGSGKVPDILGWMLGPFFVSRLVREIIEELEPGIHVFHPITVKAKDGKPIAGSSELTYFTILQPPPLECVDIDRTSWGDGGVGMSAFQNYKRLSIGDDKVVTLRRSVIEGRHFWRGAEPFDNYFFCSDELKKRLQKEKVRGWQFEKGCRVSDT
jgi:hypothetical protein